MVLQTVLVPAILSFLLSAELVFIQNIQSFNRSSERDIYDREIYSPKAVLFSLDGQKVYINSLEGYSTQVYSWPELEKKTTIKHRFKKDSEVFNSSVESSVLDYEYFTVAPSGHVNDFKGKPVEMALSHEGRYLWIPYYRRDFDSWAQSPSALSIIDTQTDQIIRVMETGPLPKFIAISKDNSFAAVVHWGDNTVALIDIRSEDPRDFYYTHHVVVEQRLSMEGLDGQNRDRNCGLCLRGAVFTPDGEKLLVGRMSGGGVAVIDPNQGEYLGSIFGMSPTPRHLLIDSSGENLFLSANYSGNVDKTNLPRMLQAFHQRSTRHLTWNQWQTVSVGKRGARTIVLSPDEKVLFAAVNDEQKIVVLDAKTLSILHEHEAAPFPVGLDVSTDGSEVWSTSQGRAGQGGGNAVSRFRLERQ